MKIQNNYRILFRILFFVLNYDKMYIRNYLEEDIKLQITYIFLMIFAVIIALFAAFNGGNVEINFLFAQIQLPQAVVIVGSAAIGAIIGYSVDILKRIKSRMRIKELEKQNKALELKLESFTIKEEAAEEVVMTEKESVNITK